MKKKNIRNWMSLNISLLIILSEVIMNLHIVLKTQKNPYLNQATQKMLAKFSYPKISRDWNFKPPNFSIVLDTRESGVPTLGLYLYLILSAWDVVEYNHCKTISSSKISLKHDTMNWFTWTEWRWTARTAGSLSSQTQVQCKKAELGCRHAR